MFEDPFDDYLRWHLLKQSLDASPYNKQPENSSVKISENSDVVGHIIVWFLLFLGVFICR